MNNRFSMITSVILITFTMPALAINKEGFFLGVGVGFQPINVDSKLSGHLEAISGFPPNDTFNAASNSFDGNQNAIAQEAHFGYFRHFPCSDWLWGAKFTYDYLQDETLSREVTLNFDNNNRTSDQVSSSVRVNIEHELSALVLIGRSYSHGFVYTGLGPVFFETKNSFSTIRDDESGYYIGAIDSLTSEYHWLRGGLLQVGLAYYPSASWFIDLNYSYSITSTSRISGSGTFTAEVNNGLNSGSVTFSNEERIISQALLLSINKVFS